MTRGEALYAIIIARDAIVDLGCPLEMANDAAGPAIEALNGRAFHMASVIFRMIRLTVREELAQVTSQGPEALDGFRVMGRYLLFIRACLLHVGATESS